MQIRRSGWEEALSKCVMTSPDQSSYSGSQWRRAFRTAEVHLQWDPERSIRGAAMDHYSIQVGLSRHIIETFVNQWTVQIEDYTPRVRQMRKALSSGRIDVAKRKLPPERLYPIDQATKSRIVPAGHQRR